MGKETTNGLNTIRDRMLGQYNEMAAGTGSTAPSQSDTTLANETYRAASTMEAGAGTGEFVNVMTLNTLQGNGNTFTEAGDLKASVLQNRHVFAGFTKSALFQLQFRLKTTLANL